MMTFKATRSKCQCPCYVNNIILTFGAIPAVSIMCYLGFGNPMREKL